MLKFRRNGFLSSSRHKAIGVATVGVVLALAAWMVLMPRLVAARLDPLLRARLGGSVIRVGRVGVSLSGPIVQGLEIEHPLLRKMPPARTRLELSWRSLWAHPDEETRLQGRTRFGPGAEIHWQAEIRGSGSTLQVNSRDLPLAYVVGLLPPLPWEHAERSFVDMEILVQAPAGAASEPAAAWEVQGEARVRDVALRSSLLSDHAVTGIALEITFQGMWQPVGTDLGPFTAQVTLPPVEFAVAGTELHWTPAAYRLELAVDLQETACADLLAAVPGDLLGEAAGFRLAGDVSGKARIKIDSRQLEETGLEIEVMDACRALAVPPRASDLRQEVFTHAVAMAEGGRRLRTAGPGTAEWRILPAISPWLIDAVLVQEDAGFFEHAGFSLPDIRAALVSDLQAGGTRRGASTLTMQLARNLFLTREKTLARKLQEVLYAWWLEQTLSKDDILEMYLNVVEFGPRLYGAGLAAEHYFQHDVGDLSATEAAFLTVILPAPYRFHDELAAAGDLTVSLSGQVRRLLRRMAASGYMDAEQLEQALADVAALHPRTSLEQREEQSEPAGDQSGEPAQGGIGTSAVRTGKPAAAAGSSS